MCLWTLLALLYDYLSQLQQCLLEGEKINGEKMLKTKMAEEGRVFLRRVDGSRFAENRARIS